MSSTQLPPGWSAFQTPGTLYDKAFNRRRCVKPIYSEQRVAGTTTMKPLRNLPGLVRSTGRHQLLARHQIIITKLGLQLHCLTRLAKRLPVFSI